jgi:hypothetical protein
MRHLLDDAMGVPEDTDGVAHLTKVAWRAMAALQKACEKEKPAPEANPWRDHDGGPCPVPGDRLVEIKYRAGVTGVAKACNRFWGHHSEGSDIVAYKMADE